MRNSYRALCAFLGGEVITYDEFFALLFVDLTVNPIRRIFAYIRASRRTGIDRAFMLQDNWRYAREWWKRARPFR